MFGGYGLFLDGLMFALVIEDTLYLKADEHSRVDFEDRDLPPFTYGRQGKQIALSYFQAPEEALDDSQMLADWANRAFAAALQARR
ncbi:TfoX/Sxy family protein [Spongiibacter sp. KMU-158]|uniref:TfoX/Sxy family protein n=2 Tax=Spongiibacter pelagi TaxID=2760804 RepID=A0A927C1Q3_9GAMM|nr:TfoX/Sxy family protein [Spongiibacter pelagi]